MLAELLTVRFSSRCHQECLDHIAGSDLWAAKVQLIEAPANRVHGVYFQSLTETRFVTDQASQSGSQGMRQGIGKSGEQHPGIGVGTGQKDGPMQGHDGLAGASRTSNPCGAAIVP